MANITLLDNLGTKAAPTAATDGASLKAMGHSDDAALLLWNSDGTGATLSATVKVWLYSASSGRWAPAGTAATAANKGLLNDGAAMTFTATDNIDHTEILSNLRHYDRIDVEIVAIAGTGTPKLTIKLVSKPLRTC